MVIVPKTKKTGGGGTVTAQETCGHSLAYGGSSQLRMNHITGAHNEIYRALVEFREFQKIIKAKNVAGIWQQQLDTITNPQAVYSGVRGDILKALQRPTQSEQDKLVSFLLSMVTKQGVSFATLTSPIFRGMMKLANPSLTIPATPTLQRLLGNQVNYWRREMVKFLQIHMYRGALTMDTWSSSNGDRKFLGVTLHFMDAEYKMRTLAIGMVPMEQSQTSEYLCEQLGKRCFHCFCMFVLEFLFFRALLL